MKYSTMMATALVAFCLAGFASAQQITYLADLSGAAEDDPNTSPGTGSAIVTLDLDANTMRVQAEFSGLEGTTTASHIHCCTAEPLTGAVGVATTTPTFPGFPSGVMDGTYDMTFDLTNASTYNASFVTNNGGTPEGALSALLTGLEEGRAYLNIHSNVYPGGEIRGFLVVPEPSSGLLLLLGLALSGALRRRRRMA